MKIRDLRARMERLNDDNDLVIPVEVMHGAVGGHPFLEVKGLHVGFDWDHGKVFITPESPVHEAGEGYKLEQKTAHDRGEALGFIWMAVTNKGLDAKQKVDAVRRTLKRFGFNYGLDDAGPIETEPKD